jgi:cardiolipin synthase
VPVHPTIRRGRRRRKALGEPIGLALLDNRLMQETAQRLPATACPPTEGELWAQAALRELRHANFAPAGWIAFLAASRARARAHRRRRARQHRQVLTLDALGLLGWSVVAFVGRPALAAVGAGWWLLLLLMVDWQLGMLERPDGSPLRGLGAPNLLTLLRAGVVPLPAVLPPSALAAVLLGAGASDVLDSWLARRFDQISRLGFWLDASVDGFVLAVAAVAAARLHLLAIWVALLIVARYLLPWLVIGVAYFARAQAPPGDTHVSGRIPGIALIGGLALAALRVPAASSVVVAGAASGILTFALTIAGAFRDSVAAAEIEATP